jgi:hypothetical protein
MQTGHFTPEMVKEIIMVALGAFAVKSSVHAIANKKG